MAADPGLLLLLLLDWLGLVDHPITRLTCENCGQKTSGWTPAVFISLAALLVSAYVAWSQWREKRRRARFELNIEVLSTGGSPDHHIDLRVELFVANHGRVPAGNTVLNFFMPTEGTGGLKWRDGTVGEVRGVLGENRTYINRLMDRVGRGGVSHTVSASLSVYRPKDAHHRDIEFELKAWADELKDPAGVGMKRTFRATFPVVDPNAPPDFDNVMKIEPLGPGQQYNLAGDGWFTRSRRWTCKKITRR